MSVERVICASHELASSTSSRPLHGHNWRIRAHVCTEQLDELGRVLAAEFFEAELWTVLEPLDHRHLNDLSVFSTSDEPRPMAAGIARLVAETLADRLDDGRVRLRRVEVIARQGISASWELP